MMDISLVPRLISSYCAREKSMGMRLDGHATEFALANVV